MSIERTELANREYRSKTGEILRTSDRPSKDIDMRDLASAFFRASTENNVEDLRAIKQYLRSRQTWRNEQ